MHKFSFDISLLLSAKEMQAEYDHKAELGIHQSYLFTHAKNNQWLYFIGVKHSNVPTDSQFIQLNEWWKEFLSKTNKGDVVVFVEGGLRPIERAKDADELITRFGEMGFVQDLAVKESVEYLSPEPDRKEELDYLLARFSNNEVAFYYFARMVNAWQRNHIQTPLKEYWELYRENNSRTLIDDKYDYSFDHMVKIHGELLDHPFHEGDECFSKNSNPSFNLVAEACSNFRDIHIVEEILKSWNEGKSLFIVYGSGHLVKQQKALEKLLT